MDFPIEGQALHSHTLDVVHPITGKPCILKHLYRRTFQNCIAFAKEYIENVDKG